MNYEEGFKRVFTAFAVGWVAICAVGWVVAARSPKGLEVPGLTWTLDLQFLAAAGIPVLVGYGACFVLIPWIIAGFKRRK
jgi:hypothetical protein